MGNSQPTITEQIQAFAAAHIEFRGWLSKRQQKVFDRLIETLYAHGPSLNVSEDLDFYRRVLLVAYLDLADRLEAHEEACKAHVERQVKMLEGLQARVALVSDRTTSPPVGTVASLTRPA